MSFAFLQTVTKEFNAVDRSHTDSFIEKEHNKNILLNNKRFRKNLNA